MKEKNTEHLRARISKTHLNMVRELKEVYSINMSQLIRNAIETGGLEHIDAVQKAVESTGAITYTQQAAKTASTEAIKALEKLPVSNYRDALASLAEFSINRSH